MSPSDYQESKGHSILTKMFKHSMSKAFLHISIAFFSTYNTLKKSQNFKGAI